MRILRKQINTKTFGLLDTPTLIFTSKHTSAQMCKHAHTCERTHEYTHIHTHARVNT